MTGDTEEAFAQSLEKFEAMEKEVSEPKAETPAPAATDDPLAGLSEAQRTWVNNMREAAERKAAQAEARAAENERKLRAQEGIVKPTQRKLAELEARLKAADAAKAAEPKPLPKWDKHRQILPEDADAIEERLGAALTPAQQRIAELEKEIAAFRGDREFIASHREFIEMQRREVEVNKALAPMLALVPDYRDIVKFDVMTGEALPCPFTDWLENQSHGWQVMYETDDPKAHAYLIEKFKTDTGAPAAEAKADPQAQALLAQRKAAQVVPPARGAPTRPTNDEEAYAATLRKLGIDPNKF